uniref:Uncharacterized protein n=1 Tax=Arundo donax TaxID=35708 RepID=A0A0A9CPT4_ARUDO
MSQLEALLGEVEFRTFWLGD